MAYIAPFRALRYDQSRVKLNDTITQPYDKISAEMQEAYYQASPYNLVRIILGKKETTDRPGNDAYSRAAGAFSDWRRQGIFVQDRQPSIYLYVQRFTVPGIKTELERRGLIALGRIEDYSAGVVFRHEQTLSRPKADRLDLLRATRAHFGQIFMLYSDPAGEIDGLLNPNGAPDMETIDEYGVSHKVWKISDVSVIDLVRARMREKKLIIADGHHRYETAINYRDERRAEATAHPGTGVPRERIAGETPLPPEEAPYELMMMTLVNMDSLGLVILPTHRVVHGLTTFDSTPFRDKARAHFRVQEIDPAFDGPRAAAILREAGREATAILAVTPNRAFLLDQPKATDTKVFAGLSPRQQSLDVVQLHKALLEEVLGLSEESIRDQQNLSYIRDAGEAVARVRRGAANIAFLMNPVKMEQVRDIAFGGEVLPQKSTDFFPKLLTGFTIYALE
jgi:uncharacterized protein (DUF1015 family)